jgi:hypothetical protein
MIGFGVPGLTRPRTARVRCGTCRVCCSQQRVAIKPESGDDPARYAGQTERVGGMLMLRQKPNGDCVYLGDGIDGQKACTIWGEHPAVCRAFSCVSYYLMLRMGVLTDAPDKRLLDAGAIRATGIKNPAAYVMQRAREVWGE